MNARFSVRTIALVLLPFAFFLQGCDSGGSSGDDNEINHSFSLTIESTSSNATTSKAAVQATVDGYSFFYDAENPETGEQAFAVYLSDNESLSSESAGQGLFGFVARASGRPGPGNYTFSDGDSELGASQFIGFLYRDVANVQNAPFYVVEGGTLTLDDSSEDRVSGTIEASGTAYSFSGSEVTEEPVTISGSFTARDVETFVSFATPGI